MDLPVASSVWAFDWAGLSPQMREQVCRVFMFTRKVFPETRNSGIVVWETAVEWAHKGVDVPSPERRLLRRGLLRESDPEGLAFIDHMDAIAREAVAEHLLPKGSRVYGCIATLQGGER